MIFDSRNDLSNTGIYKDFTKMFQYFEKPAYGEYNHDVYSYFTKCWFFIVYYIK